MSDVHDLEREVAHRRAELERTAASLGEKLDVKKQASHAAHRAQDRITTDTGKPRPPLVAGATAGVLLIGVLVWWRRRG